jgi:hypothetical protein
MIDAEPPLAAETTKDATEGPVFEAFEAVALGNTTRKSI